MVCPLLDDCYRFTQPTPGRDSFGALPYNFEKKKCEHFVSNHPDEESIRSAAYYAWLKMGKPFGDAETIWHHARLEAEASLGRKPLV